jgi:hypothetical protein
MNSEDSLYAVGNALESIELESPQNQTEPTHFGFSKYIVPPLLTRHPPPACGRDDNIEILRGILDDVLLKLGHHELGSSNKHRKILFGPDNKIGKNLLILRKSDPMYTVFIPEFPLLHVRKSKITVLFSAYKNAGILELLRFMRDDEEDDWIKLVSLAHIDTATRNVHRLAMSLHLAFIVSFIKSLDPEVAKQAVSDIGHLDCKEMAQCWDERYKKYIKASADANATFALHVDMMQHADEVVAVALAERLGGHQGYNLLLAAVKSSLLFSYLNGAVSYAPYSTELLLEHYTASPFDQNMKKVLFTTPSPDSIVNFSGDTKREMDHILALKSFRSGSTMESLTRRMSLVDESTTIHRHFVSPGGKTSQEKDLLGWQFTETDWKHVVPTAAVIMRRGGLSTDSNPTPYNKYAVKPLPLDPCILDSASRGSGEYLLQKAAVKLKLLGFSEKDIQPRNTITGSKVIVQKVIKTTALTIRRSNLSKTLKNNVKPQGQVEQEKKKTLARNIKQLECLSSELNTCQTLVYPDGSKPKVQKSATMSKALSHLLMKAVKHLPPTKTRNSSSIQILVWYPQKCRHKQL